MKSTTLANAVAIFLGAIAAAPAHAEKHAWWLNLEGGVEYDDNVAVDQNDDTTGIGDAAATFELDAGYKLVDTDTSRVEIGYDFYQSVYQDLSAFNYQEHVPGLTAWTKTDGLKFTINYAYTHALLDDDFFLDQHTISPSVGGNISDEFYLSVFYRYYNKNYEQSDDARDANTHQGGTDLFYDFDKPKKGYVSIGASYTSEDTDGPQYDYEGFSGRASVQFPITLFDLPGRWRFAYTYQKRNYDDPASLFPPPPPPIPTATREDDRHTVRTHIELDLTDELKAIGEYRYIDRMSNLSSADYQENIASLSLRYGF
jgi:hypothetical protein